jgi:ADP-ribosylglycohydrolase
MTSSAIDRALLSLECLSIGDAFGQRFFGDDQAVITRIVARELPRSPWQWTDDTEMAASLVAQLIERGTVDQDQLAQSFAARMDLERGYGGGAIEALLAIRNGRHWRAVSQGLFRGRGSFGNGAAMRVAPLGAYFADDLDQAILQARLSAEVTHAHPEGIAGAMAVAGATALAHRRGQQGLDVVWLDEISALTPKGYTRDGIAEAAGLWDAPFMQVVEALGNGSGISAPDTVPLSLWCAAKHSQNLEQLLWVTVSALGDRDTTCAIAAGVAAMVLGWEGIPVRWREAREALLTYAGSAPQ